MRNVNALAHPHLLTNRCQQPRFYGMLALKQLVFLLFLAVSVSARSHSATPDRPIAGLPAKATQIVYVYMSKGSVAYHSRDNCAGINHCTHEVRRMSVVEAQGLRKRACTKCY